MRNKQTVDLRTRMLQSVQKFPAWGRGVVASLFIIITAPCIYALGAGVTDLFLNLFQLSFFNPGNVVGHFVGLLCSAGSSYVVFKAISVLVTLKNWQEGLIPLNFWGLSVFAVIGAGFGTLSLSLILLPSISLKLALVFAVFIAGLVTAALVESQWILWDRVIRGKRLRYSGDISNRLTEAANHPLPWGKLWVKKIQESLGYFVLGAPGMGKSTWLEVLMTIALSGIGVIPNHRGLLYDAKPDQTAGLVPYLEALGIPYKILNPLDRRCTGWAIGKDIRGEASAAEFAAVLIPETESNNDNQYFIDAPRLLITAVIVVLIKIFGTNWTLRHLILFCSDKVLMQKLLEKHHPRHQAYMEFFKEKKGQKNEVITTIQSNLLPLAIVAARWEHAQDMISIRDWLKGEYALVLGSDFEFPETLKRINQLMFRFVTSGLKGLPDDPDRRVWMFIDELAAMGDLPQLEDILALGRSKSICTFLSTQNVPALLRILGREKTCEILGLCRWKAIMGVDSESAKFLSEYFSDYEYVDTSYSTSVSSGPQGSTFTSGTQERIGNRRTVTAQQFMDMNIPSPGPENGLHGYFVGPGEGIHFHTYGWDEIERMRVKRLDYVTAYDRISDDDPTTSLNPWTDEEREALGIYSDSDFQVSKPRRNTKQ